MNRRVDRFLKMARKASLSTPETCKFAVGAVVAMGSRVVSTGYNYRKTHPASPAHRTHYGCKGNIHAEVNAICKLSRCQKNNLDRCTVYVTRRKVAGNGMAMSKPCSYCMSFLIKHGIKDIWYTDRNGKPTRIKLS